MKTNIRYSIVDVLFWLAGFSVSLMCMIVLLSDIDTGNSYIWTFIFWGAFSLMTAMMLLDSIKNIQWFDITDGYITVYNPFGMMKRVQLSGIKKVFKTNATIWSIKMLAVRRKHIVLCINKSVVQSCIDSAYNRKKKPYIIVPYTKEIQDFICAEYKKICGEELIIK